MDQKTLRRFEAHCIQEEAPQCKASCPLHVDARELCRLLSTGKINEAWAILCRTLPLPGILARICDAPCKGACLRAQKGGSIELAALERFCAENATRTPALRPLPSRGRRAAVIGAGLPGLSAAWNLARKGISVELYCTKKDDGLKVFSLADTIVSAELEKLSTLGVRFHEGESPSLDHAESLLNDVDAVFADPSVLPAELLHISLPDPLTLACDRERLFAAPADMATGSPALLAALGHKAALSIERALQNAALGFGREKEAPYTSRLYTNIENETELAPVPIPAEGYAQDQAQQEAARCFQCECMECVNNCAYLKEFGGYPKVYARQIYNNASIVKGTRQANTMINSCMLCDLCTELCPEDFPMAELCLGARRELVDNKVMPQSAHDFALRDMAFANSDACSYAEHAPGEAQSEWAYFPGCQLSASSPDSILKSYAFLREQLDGGVGLLLHCCGAPADWAGETALFQESSAALRLHWEKMGRPKLIVTCPSCLETLGSALPEAECISLWSVLNAHVAALAPARPEQPLCLHDPCTARYDAGLQQEVRDLLHKIGVTSTEPRLTGVTTECCGFGGLLADANPSLAATVSQRRAAALDNDGVTYCAMCRDLFAKAGKASFHMLDLIFPESETPVSRPAPSDSERRENRVRLKEQLLEELWDRSAAPRPAYQSVAVKLTPGAESLMASRRILLTDIQKALHAVKESKKSLRNVKTGHSLTRFRPTNVTYWVEYEEQDNGAFLVHRVWSHRMNILGADA